MTKQVEVLTMTTGELLARKAEVEAELACLRSHRSENRVLAELGNINFLLTGSPQAEDEKGEQA